MDVLILEIIMWSTLLAFIVFIFTYKYENKKYVNHQLEYEKKLIIYNEIMKLTKDFDNVVYKLSLLAKDRNWKDWQELYKEQVRISETIEKLK